MALQTLLKQESARRLNSLDRRSDHRVNKTAEILTFADEARFRQAGVIECSTSGARVVLSYDVQQNDTIGVVVQTENGRIRTFARVAWTSPLNHRSTVAGLEFLPLGMSRAG